MQIRFLSKSEVLKIHLDQIKRYGGEPTVRDETLLESAIATPAAKFADQYLHAFPHEMAAAYLFHSAKNHPFVDGNKRTALATTLMFLKLNKVQYHFPKKKEVESFVLKIASGKADKGDAAIFFREHIRL